MKFLTLRDNFMPDLIPHMRFYIKGCHHYQLHRNEKLHLRQIQQRMHLNDRPLSK